MRKSTNIILACFALLLTSACKSSEKTRENIHAPQASASTSSIDRNEMANLNTANRAAISNTSPSSASTPGSGTLWVPQNAGGTAAIEVEEEKVYTVVETMPTYPGGEQALLRDLAMNTVYPPAAIEQEVQGVVMVRFVVLENGKVDRPVIQKGLHPECDKAAIKAVKSLKRFIPAKHQGKPVKVWFTCPIRFVIAPETPENNVPAS